MKDWMDEELDGKRLLLWTVSFMAGSFIALCLLCSCKATRHTATHDTVYVDKVRTEYRTKIDSVFNDRWHTEYVRGDTVFRVDSLVLYRYVFRGDTLTVRDSIYISKADTVTIEVKKPLTGFVKGQIAGFWILLSGLLAAAAWWVYKTFWMRK